MTLRTRVLAGLVFIALVLGIGALTLTSTTRSNLQAQLDAQLASAGELVAGFDLTTPADRSQPGQRPPANEIRQLSTLYLGYIDSEGAVQTLYTPDIANKEAALPVIDVDALREAAADGSTITVASTASGLRYRVRAVQNDRHEILIVALPMDSVDAAVSRLITLEVLVSSIGGVALLVVGWWVIHLGVRPLKSMTSAASAIASGDLSSRVPEADNGTEAGQLGVALNTMLERIEVAFDERARAQHRLQEFVADASHELRTPLATIRGYAELYRRGGLADSADLADAMRRSEQEAVRMGALVDDMLLLAELDAQRPLGADVFDVDPLVEDAARDARVVDQSRTITVSHDDDVCIVGDRDRIRQVLANLVTNAIRHTPTGAPIELTVLASDVVEIAVVDHGPGIPESVADRVFERFVRADTSRSRDRGGSGLGLSIVEAIVSAHGGSVRIRATAGGGTTVVVQLPRAMR